MELWGNLEHTFWQYCGSEKTDAEKGTGVFELQAAQRWTSIGCMEDARCVWPAAGARREASGVLLAVLVILLSSDFFCLVVKCQGGNGARADRQESDSLVLLK